MRFKEFKEAISSDLYRYGGGNTKKKFLIYFLTNPAYKFTFWMRCTKYLANTNGLNKVFFIISKYILKKYYIKFGIEVPYTTKIGKGFYISHIGGIVVNKRAIIGDNLNLSHGVTIGKGNRGKNAGYPVLGDNIFIGPGAKIIGGIRIGNNVAIGANSVVTKDVPDNCVVAGIPAKIVSEKGSKDYVNHVDY